MKITDGPVNTGTPGFYWDGITMYFVDAGHCSWCLSGTKAEYAFVEGSVSEQDAIGIIDAVERVIRTANGKYD
jgi:hypothetical protein